MDNKNQMTLMAYVDGELPDAETRALAATVERSGDAKVLVQAMRQMGQFVRENIDAERDAAGVDGEALWDGVERAIVASTSSLAPSPLATAPEPGGWGQRFFTWFRTGWHGHALSAAAAAVVVAAVTQVTGKTERVVERIRETPVASAVPVTELQSQPPVVEHVEFYGTNGAVLTIPGEDGANPTTVIWLADDDAIEDPI